VKIRRACGVDTAGQRLRHTQEGPTRREYGLFSLTNETVKDLDDDQSSCGFCRAMSRLQTGVITSHFYKIRNRK
jgi:hypothetical protein